MEKEILEKYLKSYPNTDKIIKLADELQDLKNDKQDLLDKYGVGNEKIQNMVDTIDAAITSAEKELSEMQQAEIKIMKTYYSKELSDIEKAVIRSRFWNGAFNPTPWVKVAKSFSYHRSTVESIHKEAIKKFLAA